jgi:hypothetical protein
MKLQQYYQVATSGSILILTIRQLMLDVVTEIGNDGHPDTDHCMLPSELNEEVSRQVQGEETRQGTRHSREAVKQ